MPTYRKLYTKIVDSFDFAEMPDDLTRIMWMLMIVVVDSQGRGIDSPSWINSRMFPLSPRDLMDIENSMAWLDKRGMIRRYTISDRNYFDIPTFHDYQTGTDKEAASVIPSFPLVKSYSRVGQRHIQIQIQSHMQSHIQIQIQKQIQIQNRRRRIYKSTQTWGNWYGHTNRTLA